MLQISLQMLWKERKKALNLGITITITVCVCIIFLQFFNNPIINYLVNILKDTTKVYGYEAITEYEVMRFYDGMYKGTMVIILLVIFISLIMYSCNYYNKTNSRIVGLLKIMGCRDREILFFQMIQLIVITLISYLIAVGISFLLIPLCQALAYLYMGVSENIFYYALETYVDSLPLVLLLLVFMTFMQISYSIRGVIPDLLKNDEIVSFKKRRRITIVANVNYIVLFIIGTFTIYISDLNQGLIFPAGLYVIGAYNLGVMCFPNLLEKWIKLKNIDAKESLIFNNFILNLQQMKSVILMFVLSSAILLTMMCTNLDDLQYMILFQLGYVLTNIVLSFTLINRFRINQINKKQYYRNLSRLGLNYEEIRYMTKKEKTLMYEMIAVLSLVYLSNLNIAFVYRDKMGVLSALFLILELIIPLFISYRVAVYQEEMRIRKWKK